MFTVDSESEDADGQSRCGDDEGGRAVGSAQRREAEEFGSGETAAELDRGQDKDGAGERHATPRHTTLHHSYTVTTHGVMEYGSLNKY